MTTYDENFNRLYANATNNYSNHNNINGTNNNNHLNDDRKSSANTNVIINETPITTATTSNYTANIIPFVDNKHLNANNKNALLKNFHDKTTTTNLTAIIGDCSNNNILNGNVNNNNKCQCGDNNIIVKRDLLKSVGKSFRYVLLCLKCL